MSQIKHAFIAPINYLSLIPQSSNFHLLLAHLLTDETYCRFYKDRKAKGDFIIIDNGAFEFKKPLQAEELYKLISESGVEPDVVVAPDYPFEDWTKTVESTRSFAKEYQKYFGDKVRLMAVPQSIKGDFEGWLQCYKELCKIDNVDFIGMSILGIPNAWCLCTGTEDISHNRLYATMYMNNHNLIDNSKKHHYLGLGSNIRELALQRQLGVIYSNDSSSAIWHGILGIEYDNSAGGLINGKNETPVDFHLPLQFEDGNLKVKNIEKIAYNMHIIQVLTY